MKVRKAKVTDILRDYRPGSQDWGWAAEFDEIKSRLFANPITLGSDGRVLDGHHRLLLAYALGKKHIKYVTIEVPKEDT